MKLRDWLIERGIKQSTFAKRIDVTRSHFSCIVCGTRAASRKVAMKIERETNGDITIAQVISGTGLGYEGKRKRVQECPTVESIFSGVQEKEGCRKVFSLI